MDHAFDVVAKQIFFLTQSHHVFSVTNKAAVLIYVQTEGSKQAWE
jgi:hypothetical protein